MRKQGMFSSDVHVVIVSSSLVEGLFIVESYNTASVSHTEPVLYSHCLMNQLLGWSYDPALTPGQLRSSKVVSEACL